MEFPLCTRLERQLASPRFEFCSPYKVQRLYNLLVILIGRAGIENKRGYRQTIFKQSFCVASVLLKLGSSVTGCAVVQMQGLASDPSLSRPHLC